MEEENDLKLADFPVNVEPTELPFSLPCLVKMDVRAKELFWQIGAIGSTTDINMATIYIEHGYVTGQTKQDTRDIRPVGKKTLLQQVLQECRARYQEKIQEGYHPINSNSEIVHLETMQAHKYTDKAKISFPVYVQIKEDGIFCKVYKINNKVYLVSRSNNEFHHMNHIRQQLSDIIGDAILNGELCIPNKGFQDVVSVVKSHHDTTEKNTVVLKLFDIVSDQGYEHRYEMLQNYLTESVQLIDTAEVNSKNEIQQYFQSAIDNGYEGIMVRKLGEPYQHGRSHNLLKYKKTMDDEGVIMEVLEGSGRDAGCAIFRVKIQGEDEEDVIFKVVAPGTLDDRRAIYADRQSYIGKKCIYTCQEKTKKGVPRFPKCKGIRDYE